VKKMNEMFINTNRTGTLYLSEVLVKYDFPIVFICKNIMNDKFLFYKYNDEDSIDNWIVTRVTVNDIIRLKSNKITLDEVFNNTLLKEIYYINYDYSDKFAEVIDVTSEVKKGTFIEQNIHIGDQIEDDCYINSAMEFSSETGKTSLDLVMNPCSSEHGANVTDFEMVISGAKSLINGFGNQFNLYVAPSPSSLVLRFYTDEKTSLFNQYSTEENFKKIAKVISTEIPEEIEVIVKENPKIISGLMKFSKSLMRLESNVKLVVSSPNEAYLSCNDLTQQHVERFASIIENLDIEHEEPFECIGEIHAIDVDIKTLKLITEDARVIRARYDESENRRYVVINKYRFIGVRKFKIDRNGNEVGVKYFISRIEDL